MRSRLAFGASMGIHFDTYLVDEITAVGDAAFRRKSDEMFTERLTRCSAIMVTHGLDQARKLCQHAAVLEAGQLTYFTDVAEGIEFHQDQMKRAG
jgi:capsular polysaccharide transport system ATP-binding protein